MNLNALKLTEWKGRRAVGMWLLALAVVLVATASVAPAGAGEPGEPAIGYWTDTNVVITDVAGQEIRSFPDFEKFSFNGLVLAGGLPGKKISQGRIVAFDIASGQRLFRIPDARLPVVTAGGRRVAFFPTFARDEYGSSVWMRMAGGRIRKIVQFKAGPGLPGIRHGMRAGAFPLDLALDDPGRTMAVVAGLETIRTFDVWVVDVKTKKATRMTKGQNSHNPSLSPDGNRLAVRVESPASCPDDFYGEILIGKIRAFDRVTGERKTFSEFDCEVFYDTPRWIDDNTLLAVRATKDEAETYGYDLDIVSIDFTTGEIGETVTEGNPCCLTVSPGLGKVAYAFSDRDGFAVLDPGIGTIVDFPPGTFVPHLSGDNRF